VAKKTTNWISYTPRFFFGFLDQQKRSKKGPGSTTTTQQGVLKKPDQRTKFLLSLIECLSRGKKKLEMLGGEVKTP